MKLSGCERFHRLRRTDMDALHSQTSIFYQAMPAVLADGKKIMKLIPVRRVNKQFFQTETSQRDIAAYNRLLSVNLADKAAVGPLNNQRIIRKQVSAANVSSNQVHPAQRDSETTPQQRSVNLPPRVPQTASPSTRLSGDFPVMVKSPVLPRGQLLTIPPDAQVQRVPASELPPVIKDQIFTSSVSSSASPTVVYVSPVTTVDQGATRPTPPLKLPSNTNACGPPPTGAKPQLKLVPKFSERPSSPIRWVIEEAGSPKRLGLPSLTSEDPRAGAETLKRTEDALVVFDGRVFFVANKNSSSLKSTVAVPQTRQNHNSPSHMDEVIDLCDDDDTLKDFPQQALPPYQDEDNVIFVSYIPPKPESGSSPMVPAEVLAPKRGQQRTSVRKETDLRGSAGKDMTESQEIAAETGSPAGHSSRKESAPTDQNSELAARSRVSPAAPEPCQRSDHQLRKMFGVTADVKIYLQKLIEPAVSKTPEDEEQEPSPQDSYGPKLLPEHELSDTFHMRTMPLNRAEFKLNPEPPSALMESVCSAQKHLSSAEPVIGYGEPIDEDISEMDVWSKPEETPIHLQTQTCVDTNTRRMGRTRKRTLCPCCVPAALHPAVKSGLRLEELEAWMLIAEQTGKKAARTKAARKDGPLQRSAAGTIKSTKLQPAMVCPQHLWTR